MLTAGAWHLFGLGTVLAEAPRTSLLLALRLLDVRSPSTPTQPDDEVATFCLDTAPARVLAALQGGSP